MRPAIGGFHIFHALRLAVMPSPYITRITAEMQQKSNFLRKKVFPAQKSQKRTSLPPPNANPRCPLQGAGIRAAGRPPYRRASEPPVRFGGSAAGPAARPAPTHNPSAPTQGEGCVKGGPSAGPPFAFNRGRGFQICAGYVLPLGTKKERPRPNAPTRSHARGGMCEGRTIGGSSLRV